MCSLWKEQKCLNICKTIAKMSGYLLSRDWSPFKVIALQQMCAVYILTDVPVLYQFSTLIYPKSIDT